MYIGYWTYHSIKRPNLWQAALLSSSFRKDLKGQNLDSSAHVEYWHTTDSTRAFWEPREYRKYTAYRSAIRRGTLQDLASLFDATVHAMHHILVFDPDLTRKTIFTKRKC